MHPIAERFVEEIKRHPGFVEAAAQDPQWDRYLDDIDEVLRFVDRAANEVAAAQEVFDFITAAIGDRRVPLRARLSALVALLGKCPGVKEAMQSPRRALAAPHP
jgi:hypothetical protein